MDELLEEAPPVPGPLLRSVRSSTNREVVSRYLHASPPLYTNTDSTASDQVTGSEYFISLLIIICATPLIHIANTCIDHVPEQLEQLIGRFFP